MTRSLFMFALAMIGATMFSACSDDEPSPSKEASMAEPEDAMNDGNKPGLLVFRVKGMKKTKSGAT